MLGSAFILCTRNKDGFNCQFYREPAGSVTLHPIFAPELTSRARYRAGNQFAVLESTKKESISASLRGNRQAACRRTQLAMGQACPSGNARVVIGETKKEVIRLPLRGNRQRPILPGRVQPSTFGTGELNYCVRCGNRWDLSVITTGKLSGLLLLP